ncbi:MAG: DnaJ family domain-containing protein [Deltaproteobacteria bacterium]
MNKDNYEEDQRKRNIAEKIAEKGWKQDYPHEMRRTLRLIGQHDLVGALMKQAMEQGEFDDLEGAGKPLDLEENPFEQSDLHMVNKILKNAGYAPYWIELNKETNALREKLDQEVEYFKKYTQVVLGDKRGDWTVSRYEQKKKDFYIQVREQLEEISKKILDFNLHCPVSTLGRFNFDIEAEMARIVEDIENSQRDHDL